MCEFIWICHRNELPKDELFRKFPMVQNVYPKFETLIPPSKSQEASVREEEESSISLKFESFPSPENFKNFPHFRSTTFQFDRALFIPGGKLVGYSHCSCASIAKIRLLSLLIYNPRN